MADFVVRRRKDFTFALEDGGKVYTIPAIDRCSFDDVACLQAVNGAGNDLRKQGVACKAFILRFVPDLEADMDAAGFGERIYYDIFTAYSQSQQDNGLGE